jgi:hypothetical protein
MIFFKFDMKILEQTVQFLTEFYRNPFIRIGDGTEVQTDGTEVQTGGTEVQAGGTEVQTGGTEVQADGTEVQTGGTEVQAGGTEVQAGGTQVQTGGTEVQTDVRLPHYVFFFISRGRLRGDVPGLNLGSDSCCTDGAFERVLPQSIPVLAVSILTGSQLTVEFGFNFRQEQIFSLSRQLRNRVWDSPSQSSGHYPGSCRCLRCGVALGGSSANGGVMSAPFISGFGSIGECVWLV